MRHESQTGREPAHGAAGEKRGAAQGREQKKAIRERAAAIRRGEVGAEHAATQQTLLRDA